MRAQMISCIILFTLLLTNSVFAEQHEQYRDMRLRQIERSLNFITGNQTQTALKMSPVDVDHVALQKSGSTGTISGYLHGLAPDDFFLAFVVAWSGTNAGSADSIGTAHLATINPDGNYRIDVLPNAAYYVMAVADGYITKFYDNVTSLSNARMIKVLEGDQVGDIDFFMERERPETGSIAGLVSEEQTGISISGAMVDVFSPDNPFLYGWAETNDDGRYRISDLPEGAYIASAWSREYLAEYYDNVSSYSEATGIAVRPNQTTDNIDFTLSRGGAISGTVTNEDGQGIQDAYIEAIPANADTIYGYGEPGSGTDFAPEPIFVGYGYANSDENGEYTIYGLRDDDYYVYATAWNEWTSDTEWFDNAESYEDATPVPVQQGETVEGIDFTLQLPPVGGSISGVVTNLDNEPIEGAWINAQPPWDDMSYRPGYWAHAQTDSDGRYRIENMPEAEYIISAYAQNGWQFVQHWWLDAETPEDAQPVFVSPDSETEPIDFQLPLVKATSEISGRVLSVSGEPLLYAHIQLSPAEPANDLSSTNTGAAWAWASTDSNGFYYIEELPAGRYIAQAQYWFEQSFGVQWYDHADAVDAATVIVLTEDEKRDNVHFDLEIRPYYGAIAGSVKNETTGDVVPRAYIEVTPLDRQYYELDIAFFPWNYHTVSNENGNYQLEWLPEGNYLVAVYAQGAFEYYEDAIVPENATEVKVVGGQTSAINFGVRPIDDGNGEISGQVYDEYNDGFLEIAVVTAKPVATITLWPDSEKFYTAVVDEYGNYRLTGLPAGEYYVMSFSPWHMTEYYKDAFDPADATPVKVDGVEPTRDIDFSLMPVYYLDRFMETAPGISQVNQGATIFGEVKDTEEKPLISALVHILDSSEQPVASGRTNAKGRYEFTNVPGGNYNIRAGHPGHSSITKTGANLSNGRHEVNFVLQPGTVTHTPNQNNQQLPATAVLFGNYPNPFNPETVIKFAIDKERDVKIRIFDILGRELRVLLQDRLTAGDHQANWDGRDRSGNQVTSGLYFYVLESAGQRLDVKKMTLLK